MQRKYGVCSWTFGPLPIERIAHRVAALGFDGVELHGDLAQFQPAPIAALFERNGLEIFSLTPDNVDLAHPDAALRGQAVDYYLRLLDFSAALGRPQVSVHGMVGRVRALASQAEEARWLAQALDVLLTRARQLAVPMVFELLNRYESHLVNTVEQAAALFDSLAGERPQMLLDCYHMNIEEASPAAAIRQAGDQLGLFHLADSNRQGLGAGHTDFVAILNALDEIGYAGPLIVEATAAGPDPFDAVKPDGYLERLELELARSLAWLRQHEQALAA